MTNLDFDTETQRLQHVYNSADIGKLCSQTYPYIGIYKITAVTNGIAVFSSILDIITNISASLSNMQNIPGKNAYELAIDNGFIGTEAEWLKSLAYSGADSAGYQHNQTTPSETWIINHNFGRNAGPVALYTTGGAAIIGDVVNININQTIASFDFPIAGYAITT